MTKTFKARTDHYKQIVVSGNYESRRNVQRILGLRVPASGRYTITVKTAPRGRLLVLQPSTFQRVYVYDPKLMRGANVLYGILAKRPFVFFCLLGPRFVGRRVSITFKRAA
jgi:hypothetical protein